VTLPKTFYEIIFFGKFFFSTISGFREKEKGRLPEADPRPPARGFNFVNLFPECDITNESIIEKTQTAGCAFMVPTSAFGVRRRVAAFRRRDTSRRPESGAACRPRKSAVLPAHSKI